MSAVFVKGVGAVSPAGWNVAALRTSLENNAAIPMEPANRPGWEKPLLIHNVPPLTTRPDFLAHPRLRRAGSITQHTVSAALEAIGEDVTKIQAGEIRLGVIVCVMAGNVNYSRRFYEEVLVNPLTASPLIFPETVFNAPASHLSAYLATKCVSYTLLGDEGTFLHGLATAASWLDEGIVDGCVIIGSEGMDWVVADAIRLFNRKGIHSSGAGALYLSNECPGPNAVELAAITDSFPFTSSQNRVEAARKMRGQFPPFHADELLCQGAQGVTRADAPEKNAWSDWSGERKSPKAILGQAFVAAAAWQCVAACDALFCGKYRAANVSVVGVDQQAIGARFTRHDAVTTAA